ncbi:MAG TPA: hypothetical protein VF862_04360 [Gemmatimonadales bacterium]
MTAPLAVRVTVLDTWEEFPLSVPGQTPVTEVKRQALQLAHVVRPADGYLVKYQGAELPEGNVTVAEAGVRANGALIVLSRRRTPVR